MKARPRTAWPFVWRRFVEILALLPRTCRATLAAIAMVALARSAQAHPFAYSTFEAETKGDKVSFFFRFDGTSVTDLINRAFPDEDPIETNAALLLDHKDTVFAYMDERFEVLNVGKACTRQAATLYYYHVQENRVQVQVDFDCGALLSRLEIRSTLFLDEDTPHQILGTLRHKNALEKYFFTGGERVATIDLGALKQLDNLPPSQRGGFRTATPPPGVSFAPPPADPAKSSKKMDTSAPAQAIRSSFGHFFGQGILHILEGYDHVLFVLSLLVAVATWRELMLVVTSFTLAHSITLALGALKLVTVSPQLVEPIIALSIVYVAAENLLRRTPKARPSVTFGFGLIHGLGFSFVLQGLGLPADDYIPTLLGFNLGVEAGQLMIVLPLFPLILWLRRQPKRYNVVRWVLNTVVVIVATYWFIERVFL